MQQALPAAHVILLQQKEIFLEHFAVFQESLCGIEEPYRGLVCQITSLLMIMYLKKWVLFPEIF